MSKFSPSPDTAFHEAVLPGTHTAASCRATPPALPVRGQGAFYTEVLRTTTDCPSGGGVSPNWLSGTSEQKPDPFSQPITHALICAEVARAAVADAMARCCTQDIKAAQERSRKATHALMRAGG